MLLPMKIIRHLLLAISITIASGYPLLAARPPDKHDEDKIRIIASESRTVYEYRQNGVLIMIKIVPKKGPAYYLVPADKSPHYESLDHKRKLYPQWVIKEW